MTSHVVVATGVTREAAVLHQSGIVVVAGGGDAAGLRARLDAAAAGAGGIVSFGMAGALDPTLAVGDWVIGDRLYGETGMACDPAWGAALVAKLPGARLGAVYADGRMIGTVAEKRALNEHHRALAVDMESHVAGAVAAEHGLPFAIVRCVSDGARHAMPHAFTVAMRADGGVSGRAMLRSLAARPGQVMDVARTAAGFANAMGELKRGAIRIGPRMGLPD